MGFEPKSSVVDCNYGARRLVCYSGTFDILVDK